MKGLAVFCYNIAILVVEENKNNYMYSRTSMARTLMARLPCLFQTRA